MLLIFQGNDYGPCVFGKEILKKYRSILSKEKKINLQLFVQNSYTKINSQIEDKNKKIFCEKDFWDVSLKKILSQTRFGRIGIFCERKNFAFLDFFKKLKNLKSYYNPSEKKRAEKKYKINLFEIQILHEMANEGLADSVEFRRLFRKFIRKAKSYNCDTIFFPEAIFGEKKTQKILKHIVGTQIKIFFPHDFLFDVIKDVEQFFLSEKKEKKNSDLNYKIFTKDNFEFTQKRAEKILQTKIKKSRIFFI